MHKLREPLVSTPSRVPYHVFSGTAPPAYSSLRTRYALVATGFGLVLGAAAFASAITNVGRATTIGEWYQPAGMELWETAEGGRRLEQVVNPSSDTQKAADVTFTFWTDDERGQPIIGFGGALTQASGTIWNRLSQRERERLTELLFGDTGLRATLARIPINSCDFAEASYSADDVAGDYKLEHFAEALPDDELLLLPLVRAALAAGNGRVQLLASPWSPPAWMKSNGEMNGNGAPRGLKPEAASAWAECVHAPRTHSNDTPFENTRTQLTRAFRAGTSRDG